MSTVYWLHGQELSQVGSKGRTDLLRVRMSCTVNTIWRRALHAADSMLSRLHLPFAAGCRSTHSGLEKQRPLSNLGRVLSVSMLLDSAHSITKIRAQLAVTPPMTKPTHARQAAQPRLQGAI